MTDGARRLLGAWQAVDTHGWKKDRSKRLADSIRYFQNHLHQMSYKCHIVEPLIVGAL